MGYELSRIMQQYGIGAVPASTGFAEGGPAVAPVVAPNYDLQALAQRYRDENDSAVSMLEKSLSSPELEKAAQAEMFFRLASAFGSPTKSGAFGENLALAGGQMGDYQAAQSEKELKKIALRQEGQKLRVAGAKNDLDSAVEAARNQDLNQKWEKDYALKQESLSSLDAYRKAMANKALSPAQVKAEETRATIRQAKQNLSYTLARIRDGYKYLEKMQAIPSGNMSAAEKAVIRSEGIWPGTLVSGYVRSPEVIAARDEVNGLLNQLTIDIKAAAGTNLTRLMDSDKDVQRIMSGFGTPYTDINANMKLMDNLERKYGLSSMSQGAPTAQPAEPKVIDFTTAYPAAK